MDFARCVICKREVQCFHLWPGSGNSRYAVCFEKEPFGCGQEVRLMQRLGIVRGTSGLLTDGPWGPTATQREIGLWFADPPKEFREAVEVHIAMLMGFYERKS